MFGFNVGRVFVIDNPPASLIHTFLPPRWPNTVWKNAQCVCPEGGSTYASSGYSRTRVSIAVRETIINPAPARLAPGSSALCSPRHMKPFNSRNDGS